MSISKARVTWQAGLPVSEDMGDPYYSLKDPEGESQFVFLAGNDLPKRWQNREHFTIAETGFGTGLNLISVMAHFNTQPWQQLTYVSWENAPMDREQLAQAHEPWPKLNQHASALRQVYPPLEQGVHHLSLPDYRIALILVFADVAEGLSALPRPVDAWFLDGFAPRLNPDMWTQALFEAMATHTAPGGTVATFTAAGVVTRGLKAAGFEVTRPPGFAGKRNMLRGHFPA